MADITPAGSGIRRVSGHALERVVAGENLTLLGMPLYKHTDNKYYRADANASGKENAVRLNTQLADTDEEVEVAKAGTVVDLGVSLSVLPYILSNNVGKIAPSTDLTTGMKLNVVGVPTAATEMLLTFAYSGQTA